MWFIFVYDTTCFVVLWLVFLCFFIIVVFSFFHVFFCALGVRVFLSSCVCNLVYFVCLFLFVCFCLLCASRVRVFLFVFVCTLVYFVCLFLFVFVCFVLWVRVFSCLCLCAMLCILFVYFCLFVSALCFGCACFLFVFVCLCVFSGGGGALTHGPDFGGAVHGDLGRADLVQAHQPRRVRYYRREVL